MVSSSLAALGNNNCERKLRRATQKSLRECSAYRERAAMKSCIEQKMKERELALQKCRQTKKKKGFVSPLERKRQQWRKERLKKKG